MNKESCAFAVIKQKAANFFESFLGRDEFDRSCNVTTAFNV